MRKRNRSASPWRVLPYAVLCGVLMVSCNKSEELTTEVTSSPYVTQVLDYRPAPGQFTGTMPQWEEGDTQEAMNRKALEAIGGNNRGIVSLGSFGGYIVVGFDHPIENVAGQRDFRILGNAFYGENNSKGGSSEPGIVMVAYDKNGNGVPDDDEWYELAGSEYSRSTRNYEITYYKPEANTPDGEYIRWTDNQGASGYIERISYHANDPYYPQWIDGDTMTFKGTLLPPNGVNEGEASGTEYWVLYAYDWGYADNCPNTDEGSTFDIDWAVDEAGRAVSLPQVDFIKIYTGVRQECGWIGDTSTEVCGVEDLHLLGNE